MISLADTLWNHYSEIKESSIQQRRFKHSDLESVILELSRHPLIKTEKIALSTEGRAIYRIRIGVGRKRLLFWSQMHGNEPTASQAILDILRFFIAFENDAKIKHIINELRLDFVPMLNPDGAERFQRRNALEIDLNRDALRRSQVESNVLWALLDEKPDLAFNLHDQDSIYNVGNTNKTASISFLAPAYNERDEINDNRETAMKMIAEMQCKLNEKILGHVARYDDTFSPRCFGDQSQKAGIPTILVESGAWIGDPERQFVRQCNAFCLIHAIETFSNGQYLNQSVEIYHSIPFNKKKFYDLIVRNITVIIDENSVKGDLAFKYYDDTSENLETLTYGRLEDFGDCDAFYGFQEIDGSEFHCQLGKIAPNNLSHLNDWDLIRSAYTAVLFSGSTSLRQVNPQFQYQFKIETICDFIVRKENRVIAAIINGQWFEIPDEGNP